MKPIRYTQEMVDEYTRDGYWTDETFYDFYDRNAREFGDREALVDSKYRLTWSQAKRLVDGIAQTWAKMGIPKDARIILQSPNSVYGFLARVASERAGLISLTVYPYLRERELEHFVEKTQAEAVVICYIYRNFNYLEMYKGLQARFPFLKHIFLFEETVPAEAPANTYSLVKLAEESLKQPIDEALLKSRRFDAMGDIGLLTSTTGTTGLPKLVEWPMAPRVCTSKGRVSIWNLTKNDITMAIAPHAGGAAGTLTYFAAPLAGAKTVMLEEFSPEAALALIEKEKGHGHRRGAHAPGADAGSRHLQVRSELPAVYPVGRRLSLAPGGRRGGKGLRGLHHQRPGYPGCGLGLRLFGRRLQRLAAPDGGAHAAGQQGHS